MFGDNKPQTTQEANAPAKAPTNENADSREKTRDNAENDYVFNDWAAI